MFLRAAYDDLALLLGYENADDAPDAVRDRILADLNTSLQQLQSGGEEFHVREPMAVAVSDGVSEYLLAEAVQRVLEPVRVDSGGPLRRLASRAQVDDFGPLFLSQISRTVAAATPVAFFVEPQHDPDATGADQVKLRLHLLPAPSGAGQASMFVLRKPEPFEVAALATDTPIPCPSEYLQSVFMPLARWACASSPRFTRRDMLPKMEADFTRALGILGVLDPRRPKPPESSSAALESAGSSIARE